MEKALKKYRHAPAHLFIDDTYYFITGAIYQKRHLLQTDFAKEMVIKYLHHYPKIAGWQMKEWVVLDNHYHFLCKVPVAKKIPTVINSIHRSSGYFINKQFEIKAKPFWYQYWDRCIRDERHYYETMAYILYNPIKHGYVQNLRDYRYSSFHDRIAAGENELREVFFKNRPKNILYYDEIDDF